MKATASSEPSTIGIVGASGMVGTALVDRLSQQEGLQVLAYARTPPPAEKRTNVTWISVDLLNRQSAANALTGNQLTHVIYAAMAEPNSFSLPWLPSPRQSQAAMSAVGRVRPLVERVPPLHRAFLSGVAKQAAAGDPGQLNLTMLTNTLAALVEGPPNYFGLVTGGKYSGVHLGPHLWSGWQSPIDEDAPPAPGPNFYVELEQLTKEWATENGIAWNILRPSFLLGRATGRSFNLVSSLAVYATLLKELERPLIFPGTQRVLESSVSVTDGVLLADMFRWLTENPNAHSQTFNATNFRAASWGELWAALAGIFNMPIETRPEGFRVDSFLAQHTELWRSIADRHGLAEPDIWSVASRQFIDKAMMVDWDVVYSMDKARSLGFDADDLPASSLQSVIADLRGRRILPPG